MEGWDPVWFSRGKTTPSFFFTNILWLFQTPVSWEGLWCETWLFLGINFPLSTLLFPSVSSWSFPEPQSWDPANLSCLFTEWALSVLALGDRLWSWDIYLHWEAPLIRGGYFTRSWRNFLGKDWGPSESSPYILEPWVRKRWRKASIYWEVLGLDTSC